MKSHFRLMPAALLAALITAILFSGCDPRTDHPVEPDPGAEDHGHEHEGENGHGHEHDGEAMDREAEVRVAVAQMAPTEGNQVEGTVTFTRVEDGIRVEADLTGFTGEPGPRGFHIHEHGDCSAPDATSAGGHFNPFEHPHAGPDDEERHVGDLGNIEVDDDGNARLDFVDEHLTFDGEASIIGRSVVAHAEEDDLETQPTGDAGGRVACGVIEVVE